jgi:hypothetical protein
LTIRLRIILNSSFRVQSPVAYPVIESQLNSFFPEILFPLLCFNNDDAELWANDPHEYIKIAFDVSFDTYNPKVAAANVLVTLTKSRPKSSPIILKILNQILLKLELNFVINKVTQKIKMHTSKREHCTVLD